VAGPALLILKQKMFAKRNNGMEMETSFCVVLEISNWQELLEVWALYQSLPFLCFGHQNTVV
jgi:hypothetical protein